MQRKKGTIQRSWRTCKRKHTKRDFTKCNVYSSHRLLTSSLSPNLFFFLPTASSHYPKLPKARAIGMRGNCPNTTSRCCCCYTRGVFDGNGESTLGGAFSHAPERRVIGINLIFRLMRFLTNLAPHASHHHHLHLHPQLR